MLARTDAAELLGRINAAVAIANDAEKKVEGARADYVSRGRAVGMLLLELKALYPKPKEFEAKLTEVSGLQRTRAYDYMALAGGRKTEEGLREEARLRKKKERERKTQEKREREQAEKAKPKPIPKPQSVTVTDEEPRAAPVTEETEAHDARWHLRKLMGEAWRILNAESSWPNAMSQHRRDRRAKALKQFQFLQSELPNLMTPTERAK